MKKIILILFLIVIPIVMSSCNTKNYSLNISDLKASDLESPGDLDFSTQYKIYGKDTPRIICFIENNSDTEYMYGEPYSIEKLIDGIWYVIPFPENAAWNDIGYILAPKSINTVYISLSYLNYKYSDGTYRIIKRIGDKNYSATFELGKSDITAATPYGFDELKKLGKNYTMEQAITDGAVVITYDGIENSKNVELFVLNVSRNIASMLRIIQYTDEGDPIIKDITYHVDPQGSYYIQSIDNSRDQFAGGDKGIKDTIYSYMVTDGSYVYLSNYAKWEVDLDQKNTSLVGIFDNNIWKSIVPIVEEMTEKRLMSNSTIYKVFSSDGTKNIILTGEPLEFGYNNEGFGEIRKIENKLGSADKIKKVLWVEKNTILIVCETNTDFKYYEFFDVEKRILTSYTTSTSDYYWDNGKIIIPE